MKITQAQDTLPSKTIIQIDGAIKVFHDHYKRFFKGFCTEKVKPNITMKG
jgi:hypothetical protein